jgi:hypothetical protein
LSINWGAWSEIGAAVRYAVHGRMSADGIGAIAPPDGLDVLESLMQSDVVQAVVTPVDWTRFGAGSAVSKLFSRLSTTRASAPALAAPAQQAGDDFVTALRRTPAARQRKVVAAHVRQLASRVLGGGRAAEVDARVPLNEVGLDSLMAVELRNVLGASIARTLPATLLFDYPTIDALTTCLLDLLVEPEENAVRPAVNQPNAGTAAGVIDQLDELSDEEIDRLLAARMSGN